LATTVVLAAGSPGQSSGRSVIYVHVWMNVSHINLTTARISHWGV